MVVGPIQLHRSGVRMLVYVALMVGTCSTRKRDKHYMFGHCLRSAAETNFRMFCAEENLNAYGVRILNTKYTFFLV